MEVPRLALRPTAGRGRGITGASRGTADDESGKREPGFRRQCRSAPYSFLYLENLRDAFDDGKTLVAVLEAEVTSSVELVDRAGDYQEKNERERRRIKEQLETLDDLEPAERLRTELLRAELSCRIGRELVNLRKTEWAIKKLDLENRRQRQTLLEQRLIQVEEQARFTRSDLDKKLQSIDTFPRKSCKTNLTNRRKN